MLVKSSLLNYIFLFLTTIGFMACGDSNTKDNTAPVAGQTLKIMNGTPVLDGSDADDIWEAVEWQPMNALWGGVKPEPADFQGRYKLCWDENNLYVLAEITDDTLSDTHPDGLDHYWNDDCLVLITDEDASGGAHQFDFNAFAYHVALDGRVADVAVDSSYRFFDDHVVSRRTTRNGISVWEVAIKLYDGKTYSDASESKPIPKMLSAGKKIGFAVGYCDNDHSTEREHYIGSVATNGQDPAENASVLQLVECQ